MKVQFENKVMSSFLQFVDNKIVDKGEAYTNHSSYTPCGMRRNPATETSRYFHL